MNFKFPKFVFFLLAFGLFSCETPQNRFEKMSVGWCNCIEQLLEVNERAQKLTANPDSSAFYQAELMQLFQKMESMNRSSAACSSVLKDKFGSIKNSEWAVAEPIFWKNCPKTTGKTQFLHEMLGE